MGVHWKTKSTQRNLLGKSTLAHQANLLSPAIQYVGVEELDPAAWNYFNAVGEIWLADPKGSEGGDYFNSPSGTCGLYVDEPEGWGGAYFNR